MYTCMYTYVRVSYKLTEAVLYFHIVYVIRSELTTNKSEALRTESNSSMNSSLAQNTHSRAPEHTYTDITYTIGQNEHTYMDISYTRMFTIQPTSPVVPLNQLLH